MKNKSLGKLEFIEGRAFILMTIMLLLIFFEKISFKVNGKKLLTTLLYFIFACDKV